MSKRIILFISVICSLNLYSQTGYLKTTNEKQGLEVIQNSEKELVVRNNVPDIDYKTSTINGNNYLCLSMDGYSNTFTIGAPKLPVLRKFIEIPIGSVPEVNVTWTAVKEYNLNDLGISFDIIPVQPPAVKGAKKPEFVKDKAVYGNNSFYGDKLAAVMPLGIMRCYNIARLDIAPVKYNPVTNTIRVYSDLEVKVTFREADMSITRMLKQKYSSPFFNAVSDQVINHLPLSHWKDTLTSAPVKYVIVSHPMFQAALQPFIAWKIKKGFTVVEAYTNNPNVGTTTTSIKAYLQSLYTNATPSDPAPTFILLVGDVAQIPSFQGTTGSHVTDLYYAEYTGDFFPEVYYGRFSATSLAELQPQIDKTLEYEQYLFPDPSFLNYAVMVAGIDGSMSQVWANGQINYGTENYFNPSQGIHSYTFLYPSSRDSAAAIISRVSDGCSFANYTAHGSSSGWADPPFGVNDVPGLKNAHEYPLMVGNCCVSNKFDEPVCFGEALLRAELKGALGYIGGSDNTYWDEDYYWGVGATSNIVEHPSYAGTGLGAYDRTFHTHNEPYSEWYASMDQMVFAGNLAVTQGSPSYDYYWEIYHLLGDPSLMVYFSVPAALNVSYNATIPLGLNFLSVATEPYAYVGISQNGIWHGAGFADASGTANLNIEPFTIPGPADIVITKQNRQPFIGSLNVQVPNGPYVLMKTKVLNDPSGNQNGKPDFGEQVILDVTLKNFGLADTGVVSVLRTSDTFISLNDSTESWGDIGQNDTVFHQSAFSFSIHPDIPDQHIVSFILHISDHNGLQWNSPFTVRLNAPDFKVQNLIIDDAAGGNGNHKLDPGENVLVQISTSNDGHAAAQNTLATLSSASPYLNITSAQFDFYTFEYNDHRFASFNLSVSSIAPSGTLADLTYHVGSAAYEASKLFHMLIGQVSENWETGNMSRFPWESAGDGLWFISSENPYEGTYCLQSGQISDDQKSELTININVLSDDSISFFRKVSSEDEYDFLRFYIDGEMIAEWCGETGWRRQSFPLNAGGHILKWTYEKDYSESYGDDAAYLDMISFPAFDGMAAQDNIPEEVSLLVYPIPCKDKISADIYMPSHLSAEILIYNTIGEALLYEKQGAFTGGKHLELNTTCLPSGLYFLQLKTARGVITKKIILSR